MKVRKDEPKILKDLIILVNESFNKYKAEHTTTTSEEKIQYILKCLDDIKLNKLSKTADLSERLAFLTNFIKKSVI